MLNLSRFAMHGYRIPLLFLTVLSLSFASCSEDEVPDDGGGSTVITAKSNPSFSLIADGVSIGGEVSDTTDWVATTKNAHTLGQTSTLRYGAEMTNSVTGEKITIQFGPYYYNHVPDQSIFYTYLVEGSSVFFGQNEEQVNITYVDADGNTHSTLSHDQTGSGLTVSDTEKEGDYIYFYVQFTCKLIDGAEYDGNFVGRISRL